MRPGRALEAALVALACASSATAQTSGTIQPSIAVVPAPAEPGEDDQLLQLEVYVNERALDLIFPFTLRADGKLLSSRETLEAIGVIVPANLEKVVDIPLDAVPGLSFAYDDAAQTIHFTLAPNAQQPTMVGAQAAATASPYPDRPPLGGIVNYTLFASGSGGPGGPRFEGLSGAFETRLFGSFGLVENSFVALSGGPRAIRLDSAYSYDDPGRLTTMVAGDYVSAGFAWTRPIRMGGLQYRRSFGLRPDLVTLAAPSLTGTAAAPSMLDLYVNKVRTLSANVPQGPYEVTHPPIIYGSGQARIVLRDALGRETVSTAAFYASPDLLAPGLTDFSVELGFARRNYATRSNDYDARLAFSGSWRRGISTHLTLLGHAEGASDGLAVAGGGAVFTLGPLALASVAVAGSRAPGATGGLIDASVESRMARVSILVRAMRSFGDYQDLASWTAAAAPAIVDARAIYGQPREVDQGSLSLQLWPGAAAGGSYVRIRRADERRSRIANLSFTQDIGRLSLFASATRDYEAPGSTSIFAGIAIPLGGATSASVGATHARGATSGYFEASRQGAHAPGAFGWAARASAGEQREAEAILRYTSNFARFEATGLYRRGNGGEATAMAEGAVALVGGELSMTNRLDDSFALVEVGAPGVAVLRENRQAGVTGRGGKLIVPGLVPYVANRIAIDPEGLPVDARVEATETVATPFSRVPARVDLRVRAGGGAALVTLVDPQGRPIELGAAVVLEGKGQDFVVGYDGETYLEDLGPDNALLVTTPDGAVCRARFRYRASPGEQVRIPATQCVPRP